MQKLIVYTLVLCCLLLGNEYASASPNWLLQAYDSTGITEQQVERSVDESYRAMLGRFVPKQNDGIIARAESTPRVRENESGTFYLIVFSMILFGGVRYTNPKYFQNLFKALRSPMLTSQQLKEQMANAVLVNWLMNIFFAIAAGTYAYLLVGVFSSQRSIGAYPSMLLPVLIAVIMVIYIVKYFVLKFSGWAFNVQSIMDSYLFNVYLVNKVVAVVLLPFLVFIAFADSVLMSPVTILSFIVLGALLLYRYVRSWQVFGAFFKYSRFHFFMYLCASEILPVAVLTKVLVRTFY